MRDRNVSSARIGALARRARELERGQDRGSITSFDELYRWYKQELRRFTDLSIRAINVADRDFPGHSPYPFLSSTMEGCLESGRDATAGGTLYNFSSVNGCGRANAVNSLAAIKKIVFEEKQISLPELAKTLCRNGASMRKRLICVMFC